MSWLAILEALLIGGLIGAILGLVGAGGAILAVPAFAYLFGFGALEATTASLAVVAVGAATGAAVRARRGQVRWREGTVFWLAGIPGTVAGSLAAPFLPGPLLLGGFALVMLAAAIAMLRRAGQPQVPATPAAWPRLIGAALAIGVLTGLFGVGGGFLVVPALAVVFRFGFAEAAGTSLLVITLTSLTSLGVKAAAVATVDWRIPALVAAAALLGSLAAARLQGRIPQRTLERAFAIGLILIGLGVALDSARDLLT